MANPSRQNDRFYQRNAPPPPKVKAKAVTSFKGPKDLWQTMQIAAIEGGPTKTTKAMSVPGGVVINTCTRGATYAAEALVFIPGAALIRDGETVRLVDRA